MVSSQCQTSLRSKKTIRDVAKILLPKSYIICDSEGVVDDCCCAFWCGCCATAQIARHEYAIPATGTVKYDCCSATGEP